MKKNNFHSKKTPRIISILDIDGVLINENGSFVQSRNIALQQFNFSKYLSKKDYNILDKIIETTKSYPGFGNEQLATIITLCLLGNINFKEYNFPNWVRLEKESIIKLKNNIQTNYNEYIDIYKNPIIEQGMPSFNEFNHEFEHAYFTKEYGCSQINCTYNEYYGLCNNERELITEPLSSLIQANIILSSRLKREIEFIMTQLIKWIKSYPLKIISIDSPPCKPNPNSLYNTLKNYDFDITIYIGDSIDDIENVKRYRKIKDNKKKEILFYYIKNNPATLSNIENDLTVSDFMIKSINEINENLENLKFKWGK